MNTKIVTLILLILFSFLLFGQRYGESDDFSYALKLYNEGFFDIAAQQFSLFTNRYPTSDRIPDAEYYLGLSLLNSGDYENARIRFQSMAVSFPEHARSPEAWQKVGDCYIKLVRQNEAARAYETVKILYPQSPIAPVALYQAAEIYFQEQNYDKAELTLRDFLDRYPASNNYPNGRLLYAKLLLRKQNYDQALKEFDKVLVSGAEASIMAETYLGMGEFYSQLGQLERSREQYQLILSRYPSAPAVLPAVMNLSVVLALTGNNDGAIKLLNDHLPRYKNPNQKARLNIYLAAVYYLQGNYFAARKVLESNTASQLTDTLAAHTLFYLGNIYLKEQKFTQGSETFKKLLHEDLIKNLAPDYRIMTEKQLGYALLQQGQFEQAQSVFRTFLSRYPENPFQETILSDLFYATLTMNRFKDAEKIYRDILINAPYYPDRDKILFDLAKSYFQSGDYNTSKLKFEEFIKDFTCSAKFDSAEIFLNIVQKYFVIDQKVGVNKLANMLGRVLSQDNKQNLKMDLARIYLFQLNAIDEAIQLGQELYSGTTDSSTVGEASHLLAESYRRKAELKHFTGESGDLELQKSLEFYKIAMNYLNKVEFPDSLSYYFIAVSTSGPNSAGIPGDKRIQFWEHFTVAYPRSKFTPQVQYILATMLFEKDQIQPALQKLQSLIKGSDPALAGDAYYLMGKIYYDQKEMSLAEEILKEFLLKHSKHPLRANAFGLLAKINETQSNFELAAQFWSKLREEYDYSPTANAAKSRIPEIYLLAGEYKLVNSYTQPYLHDIHTDDLLLRSLQIVKEPEFYFFNGKAQFKLGNNKDARKTLLQYLYSSPTGKYSDEALFLLSEIAVSSGDSDAAILHLQAITKNENSSFYLQAAAKSADIYFDKNDYDKAQILYNKLFNRIENPDQKIVFASREMICLINQGNLKQYDVRLASFNKDFRKITGYDNHMANFEFEIGKLRYRNKDYNLSIKNFETVTGKYKKTDFADDAEYYLGLTYSTLNKVDKAMDILSHFSEKYPNSPLKSNIFVTLGGLYYRAEKRELAVGSFQKAVETAQDPETRKLALSNLILIYRDLGLWDGVLSQTRAYVSEYPSAADLIDKKILIGSALINLNRYSDAVTHLTNLKFEANSDQEPEIQFYIGEAYFNSGQYENSIREFVKIPLLSKQTQLQWEASALYYSAQAYEKLGRKTDAIRMYQEIVDRPGILVDLKKEAQKRIAQLKES